MTESQTDSHFDVLAEAISKRRLQRGLTIAHAVELSGLSRTSDRKTTATGLAIRLPDTDQTVLF